MSLNESIVEAAALEWFGEMGGGRVKSEFVRVKSRTLFPISLFTILFPPPPRRPARHAAAQVAERGVERGSGRTTKMKRFSIQLHISSFLLI
jgi:hypothetical protein